MAAAEIEKMNEAGCSAVVGAYASAICLATTQAAAKHGLPHVVDVGVADQIVERGLKNTFRFGPGYRKCAEVAVANLHVLNTAAGKPARTVMIIHEESLFGTGTANLLARELPGYGYEVKEVIKHANPTRDFNNIVLRMKSVNPDIVIPANYYNEYALLVRTMAQQKVAPKAIYPKLLQAKQAADLHTPSFNQRLVAEVLKDGFIERHVPTIRALYKQQCEAMLAALDREMAGLDFQFNRPAGGMFLWARLPKGMSAVELLPKAVEKGVAFVPGAPFYADHGDARTLRLSFVTPSVEEIRRGVAALAQAIQAHAAELPACALAA